MDASALGYVAYWRNSLADAEFGQGAFTKDDTEAFSTWCSTDIAAGCVDKETVAQFFLAEPADVKEVKVVLRPCVYIRLLQHGKEPIAGAPSIITPLVSPAVLTRDGYFRSASGAIIPRDLLEPLPKGTFSIGDIEQFDRYKTLNNTVVFISDDQGDGTQENNSEHQETGLERFRQRWNAYLRDCDGLLHAVAGDWLKEHEQYEKAEYGFILKKTQPNGASKHVIALYDHLLTRKPSLPLLMRFASSAIHPAESRLPSSAKFAERLGHSGDKFPLAVAQRDALSHFLNCDHGEILAINGPPGTGKTTLVLSIIATLWARAALAKTEPPVVIATSTNNQAVTNIIEAFGKDFATGSGPLAGRWLPDVKSFGTYYPASSKRNEASAKYQTEDFFDRVESDKFITEATEYYLDKAQLAFPNQERYSIEMIVELLHQELQQQAGLLLTIETAWQKLCQVRSQRSKIADDIDNYIVKQMAAISGFDEKIIALKTAKKRWHKYLANESLMYALFSWLPVVRHKRHLRIKSCLESDVFEVCSDIEWSDINEIETQINNIINATQQACDQHQQFLKAAQDIVVLEKKSCFTMENCYPTLELCWRRRAEFHTSRCVSGYSNSFPYFSSDNTLLGGTMVVGYVGAGQD